MFALWNVHLFKQRIEFHYSLGRIDIRFIPVTEHCTIYSLFRLNNNIQIQHVKYNGKPTFTRRFSFEQKRRNKIIYEFKWNIILYSFIIHYSFNFSDVYQQITIYLFWIQISISLFYCIISACYHIDIYGDMEFS